MITPFQTDNVTARFQGTCDAVITADSNGFVNFLKPGSSVHDRLGQGVLTSTIYSNTYVSLTFWMCV